MRATIASRIIANCNVWMIYSDGKEYAIYGFYTIVSYGRSESGEDRGGIGIDC